MPNSIKYSTSTETLALRKGNFWIGTGDVSKGPTENTGYWNGITPPDGGYTVYLDKETQGPSIYTCAGDSDLINLTNKISGESYTTVSECLEYFAGQSNKMVFNTDYPTIVTDGLVLNIDSGFVPSYPRTGTTWYDLSGNEKAGTLTNGPTFNSSNDGSIQFDGNDDYIQLSSSLDSLNGTAGASLSIWLKLVSGSNSAGRSGIIQLSGYNNSNGCLYYYTDAARVGGIWLDIFRTDRVFTGDWQPTFDAKVWHNLAITTTPGSGGWKMYLNGILGYSTTGQNTVSVDSSLFGGFTLGQNSGSRRLWGNIAVCSVYNRNLTDTEILQNYNATKTRFGL